MSDALDRWLQGEKPVAPSEEEPQSEAAALLEQLDALGGERAERRDPRWFPPGPDGLERLVEERRARGVLRPPRVGHRHGR